MQRRTNIITGPLDQRQGQGQEYGFLITKRSLIFLSPGGYEDTKEENVLPPCYISTAMLRRELLYTPLVLLSAPLNTYIHIRHP